MSDWEKRAAIAGDVVYFSYVAPAEFMRVPEAYVWDLDKTYLDTKYESIRGLFRTFFENAVQKRNVPGTQILMQGLRETWFEQHQSKVFPLFFITASPPQLEEKIIAKLHHDGVRPVGIFAKDNLKNLRPKRLWRLTHQLGFKLQALLQLRVDLGPGLKQILWGDDSETDAIAYSLYSDICARRIDRSQTEDILKNLRVVGEQTATILELQERIPHQDPVDRIYINLEADTDAEYYLKFGRRILPTYNSFQTAMDLLQEERLKPNHVVMVARDLAAHYGFTVDELEWSLDDLVRRQVLTAKVTAQIIEQLKSENLLHPKFEPSVVPVVELPRAMISDRALSPLEAWIPERIDYLNDYR